MRFSKISATCLIVASLSLTGCCAFQFFSPRPHPAINYSYHIENGNSDEIVQIFTLNGETVIQFRELRQPYPKILDMQSKELPFQVIGYSYVLTGIHPQFRIVSERGEALITLNSNMKSQDAGVSEDIIKDSVSPENHSERNNNNRAGNEISDVKETLAGLHTELAQLKQQLNMFLEQEAANESVSQSNVTIHDMKMVRYSFTDGGSTFTPADAIRDKLADFGKHASDITVTGYTYANRASARYQKLARMRAESARNYLVSIGIPAEKIRVNSIPAGHFVTENKTDAGKQKNRRVEIVFFSDAESK